MKKGLARTLKRFVSNIMHEPCDVFVGRPSIWGNPFSHEKGTRAAYQARDRTDAIEKYEAYIRRQPALVALIKKDLRGKVLGCYCYPLPCHGDVLARIANEKPVTRSCARAR